MSQTTAPLPSILREGQTRSARVSWRRVAAGLIALGSASVLIVAAWLTPSPNGIGTHRVLNLPPCGWIATVDLPCPTCGMTTAFAHAADGNFAAAFHAQPLGLVLCLITAMTLLVAAYVGCTGSRLPDALSRLWGRWTAWTISAVVVASWIYKILAYKGWTEW